MERILGGRKDSTVQAATYARASSTDQKEDLERQIERLLDYCTTKGYSVVAILKDIASGLKTNRRNLLKLFELVADRKVDVVVITYRDRLTRFGFEYLEHLFKKFGARIEVAFGKKPKDTHQELVEDLIAIITSFARRLYEMRSHKKKNFIEEFKVLLDKYGAKR